MKIKANRVSDRVAYIVIFVTTFEVAGMAMSLGRQAVFIQAPVASLVWAVFVASVLFVPDFLENRWKERGRRPDRCPTCDYELPSEGVQRCSECGVETTLEQRKDTKETEKALARNLAVSGKLLLAAYFAALGLTFAEYAAAYAFGQSAFQRATGLQYKPTRRTSGGWVIPAYQEARVFGGAVYDDTESKGISPEIFRATRWAPWLHLGDLFYVENTTDSRVFTWCDYND